MKGNKIVVLSDNRNAGEALLSEHGLSAILYAGKLRILLDTGASGQFAENAKRLGIDLTEIDYVFISHGHADHAGGLTSFLEMNSRAKVLLSAQALNQRFFSTRNGTKEIGTDFDFEKYRGRCVFIDRKTVLDGDICVFPCDVQSYSMPKANGSLFKDAGHGLEPDDFNHELVFCYGRESVFVFTGCAHKGLLNILASVKDITGKSPEALLGGFHLLDGKAGQTFETEKEIAQIGFSLVEEYPETRFMTGHCTGDKVFGILKDQLKHRIELFYTGFIAPI